MNGQLTQRKFQDILDLARIAGSPYAKSVFDERRGELISRYGYDTYRDMWRDACRVLIYTDTVCELHAKIVAV